MLMFFAWLKKRREERALIESDAVAMIEKFDCRPWHYGRYHCDTAAPAL